MPTNERHKDELVAGGGIICDEGLAVDREDLARREIRLFPVPLSAIAEEVGDKIMANNAALGAADGVTGYEFEHIASVIRDNFARKGQPVVDANLEVASRAYNFARDHYAAGYDYKLKPVEVPPRMVLNGNEAFCLGALLGGCRFVSAYPMTPASSIIEWMSAHAARHGLVTKHTEDEIAAICMAIGANHAGVRAMAATSGGGFSLMVEALGLAGMTETPLVIVEAQRPGPSTGMPTRTEQGDLLFVLHASQGDFPRIVLAPGTVEECFYAGWRAFNLAERYQCPVLVLTDNFLANAVRTVERADLCFEAAAIDRGALLSEEEMDQLSGGYKRYAVTETGISPRARPGHPKVVFLASSDEHTEDGHFEDEDPENRVRMVQKRLRKLEVAVEEMRPPALYGPAQADVTLVGWGSSYGLIAVENNATGQFARRASPPRPHPHPRGPLTAPSIPSRWVWRLGRPSSRAVGRATCPTWLIRWSQRFAIGGLPCWMCSSRASPSIALTPTTTTGHACTNWKRETTIQLTAGQPGKRPTSRASASQLELSTGCRNSPPTRIRSPR